MTHYPYPSIDQFRNTVKNVRERADHLGLPIPTITFTGTVKLHGTNASVVFPGDGSFYPQSRTRIISVEDDNHGFAKWVDDNKGPLQVLAYYLRMEGPVVLYGEWFGQGIQSGVAVSSLPKSFVVFGMKQIEPEEWFSSLYVKRTLRNYGFVTIWDFPTYEITIDFQFPELSQNRLVEITEAVEKECPVGKQLGAVGVGEGVVWSPQICEFPVHGLQFKVKGEKHSESRVKTLAAVDVEKIENLRILVDTIEASGFHSNEVMGEVQKRAKKFWMEKLNG